MGQTSSDDLVIVEKPIVEKPIVENESAVGIVTDDEGSDSESDDEYDEEWESFRKERELILQDTEALRQLAFDYCHPGAPVTTSAECYGRNYFSRPSAPQQESVEEAEERAAVLADAAALKKLAVMYAHPEAPVTTSAECYGRNYFSRPSAPEQESVEEAEERAAVLADATALKKLAVMYAHPEAPVTTSAECYGRNYFTRPSAPEQESVEEAEERTAVLADAAALKKLAVMYAHPEAPVTTSAECYGRNYFTRPSAPVPTESVQKNTSQVQPKTVLPSVQKTVKVSPPMGPETDDITRSASSVQLYGLDSMDNQAF